VTIRVALLGRGMAGTVFHAPLIRALSEFELAAVAGSADAAAAIASPGIDLVVVATPNASHFPLAAAALEAGKHVVVDKPFVLGLDEADALIALAAARGRILTVFHNRRWDGDFLAVRRLVESGRLGAIAHFEAHWDRFRPVSKAGWREEAERGSGLLWDLGPHLIDQALVLFGSPDAVTGDTAVQRQGARAVDYFELVLRYGEMRAVLSASSLIAAPRPRFAVYGLEGTYISHGIDPQEAKLKGGIPPNSPGYATENPTFGATFANKAGEIEPVRLLSGRYVTFYEGVAAAIRGNGPPPVDPADAREGLRILALARSSG
jgi:scyllo-inositol 2-dehydrogenase (NADP+)